MPRLTFLSLLVSMFALSSCVSTETVEPSMPGEANSEIVLNLTSEELPLTKADNGYKLRYIARIFSGSSNNVWSYIESKEIIDGESNNRIVFSVSPNSNYTLMVFADYIPSNSSKGADGYYPDYFYDTKSNKQSVTMRTTPGSSSTSVSPDFFNNDNYDAFYGIHVLYKEEKEYVVNMTLHRVTAQVVFRDNSGNTGDCNVSVDKLGLRSYLAFDKEPVTTSPGASESNKSLGNIGLTQTSTVNATNKNVFYFYTLADLTTSSQFVSTEFKVTRNGVSSPAISVKEIPVKSNFRTVVAGSFLPSESKSDPSDGDNTDPGAQDGDIILNLSCNYDWEQQPLYK